MRKSIGELQTLCQYGELISSQMHLMDQVSSNRAKQYESCLHVKYSMSKVQNYLKHRTMTFWLAGKKLTRACCRILDPGKLIITVWYIICLMPVMSLITFPSADNDLLIVLASSKTLPSVPVFSAFSDSAKSTRSSLPHLYQ